MASKLSRDLSNFAIQLRTGQTRGANPRKLTDDEIEDLRRCHDGVRAQMSEVRKQRILARVNAHTTAESDRVIAASASHSGGVIAAISAAVTAAKSEILGARSNASAKRAHGRLVGATVVAAQPDQEMGDSIFEICHVESQTWADGDKHTVCIIKAEGKATLSRDLTALIVHDPLTSRDPTQPVRVVVTPHDAKHAQFHVGWRGIVQVAKASTQNVKVNFPILKTGTMGNLSMMVPRTALKVLGADDISMLPNTHPWLGKRVKTLQTGQVGEIVDVNSRYRVKVALEGPEKKKAIFVESKGSSFEALFTVQPEAEVAPVLPDPPQADEAAPQATPQDPQAAEVESSPVVSKEDAHQIADSDAESLPPAQGSDEDDEPIVAAPKRRGKRPAKAAAVKRPAASTSSAPKRRRQSRSLGNVD